MRYLYFQTSSIKAFKIMSLGKKFYVKLGLNTLVLAILALPILLYWLIGKPATRGFYCNDESLSYSYHGSTVKNYYLYTFGLAVPMLAIIIGELIHKRNNKAYFDRIYWLLFGFLYGVALCQSLTDLAKYSVGRLRPHFFEVCQPDFDQTLCQSSGYRSGYVEDYECQGNSALFPVWTH